MLQPGQGWAAEAGSSRLGARARLWVSLLGSEVLVGSPTLARVGLVGLALALQTIVLVSPGHFRPAPAGPMPVFVSLATLGALVLARLATFPLRRLLAPWMRQTLALAALMSLPILSVVGVVHGISSLQALARGAPYSNDGAVMDLYAAERVRHGHNPYLKTNIVLALAAIDAPATTTTPLMDGQFRGARAYPSESAVEQAFMSVLRHHDSHAIPVPPEFESKYNYPAGSFLFILPFVWAGIHDMRFLYLLAILGMGAYLWRCMPRSLRPLVPLLLIANVPLVVLTLGGQPDPLYGLFLMVGYAEWGSAWISPACMGIAVSTKQVAWFFLPFYLILVARELGWREAARRGGLIVGLFAVSNGPFVVQSPAAYLSSIAGPMADPMFPLGIGVMALFVSNVLPMLPKLAFTVAETAAWVGSIVAVACSRWFTPAAGIVLGALPLFFAWRSLVNYFYLVPLLVLAVVLAESRQRVQRLT